MRSFIFTIALMLTPYVAFAGGIGKESSVICSKSCKFICKSSFVERVIKFDGKAPTTKIFAAFIGTTDVTVFDTVRQETLRFPDNMGYVCEEE